MVAQHTDKIKWGLLIVSILLIVYVRQLMLAEDAEATPEAAPVTAEATEEPSAEAPATAAPIVEAPTIEAPTLEAPTMIYVPPTQAPTDVPPAPETDIPATSVPATTIPTTPVPEISPEASEEAAPLPSPVATDAGPDAPVTDAPDIHPEASEEATLPTSPAAEVLITATVMPDTPAPTLTDDSLPDAPTEMATMTATAPEPELPADILLLVDQLNGAAEGSLTLTVYAENMQAISSVVLICQADPAVLTGQDALVGDLIPAETGQLLDDGFQADGVWALAASQFPQDLWGTGALWHLKYHIRASAAVTRVLCQAHLSDAAGMPLPAISAETALMTQLYPTATPETPATQTDSPTPTATEAAPTPSSDVLPQVDPQLVAQHYGLTVPPADAALDLNRDGLINIYDLVLASAHRD